MNRAFRIAIFMIVLALLVPAQVSAQSTSDWIKITPPPGMRWKTLDQSTATQDITYVDSNGDTWLRKSAAATWSRTFVLVQLVGDTSGADEWTDLVEAAPSYLHLRPDPEWSQPEYRPFTSRTSWRELITAERVAAFRLAGSDGIAVPRTSLLPVYQSQSNPRASWWSPEQGPFPADAQLVLDEYQIVPRAKAGVDTPYTVGVQDLSTDPPTEETRPGGYELYRNYTPQFNPDGSWTLTVAGDFSFQKDYLFPIGGPLCPGGLPRMPDGTCVEQPPPVATPGPPIETGPRPTPSRTPAATLDNPPLLAQPLPTLPPTAPLTAPGSPRDACSALPGAYVNFCGEARARAAGFGTGLPLPKLALHANPERGLVRVPTWLWADGGEYTGGPVSGVASVDLPWSHDWDTCSTDETAQETSCEHHHEAGSYHLSLMVRFRPGRYVWSFGDRSRLDTGSLGQPYPAESDVQHIFRDTSLGQAQNAYTIALDIDWVGDWSVSGDAEGQGGLSGRQTAFTLPYAVREAQAVRCSADRC